MGKSDHGFGEAYSLFLPDRNALENLDCNGVIDQRPKSSIQEIFYRFRDLIGGFWRSDWVCAGDGDERTIA
jgi:hypothetical protein